MKKIISLFTTASVITPIMITLPLTFAAPVAKFQLEAPLVVQQGSPFDVRVRAVDVHGNIDQNYNGSVVFSTDWIADTVPTRWVQLKNGEAFLDDEFILKREGEQSLYVADEKDVMGEVKLRVQKIWDTTISIEKPTNPLPWNRHNLLLQDSIFPKQNLPIWPILSKEMSTWEFLHCSLVARGFLWTQPIGEYINPRTCGLLGNNFGNSGMQIFPNGRKMYQNPEPIMEQKNPAINLADAYAQMRKMIAELKKQPVSNQAEAIRSLKIFDTILADFAMIPKNILFTEYPEFITMYFKFFQQSEMLLLAERENISFLQEYAKFTNEKKKDDIGFIVSHAPNFEYITERKNNEVSVYFEAYNIKGQKIDHKDIKINIKELPNGFSFDGEKLKFQNIDKKKKYYFTAIISKKDGTSWMNREFSLSFADRKIIDTIKVSEVSQYNILWWKLSFSNISNMNPDDKVNIFIIPFGSSVVSSFRREWQSFDDNKDGATLTNNFNNMDFKNETYYQLKYFYVQS